MKFNIDQFVHDAFVFLNKECAKLVGESNARHALAGMKARVEGTLCALESTDDAATAAKMRLELEQFIQRRIEQIDAPVDSDLAHALHLLTYEVGTVARAFRC